MNDFCRELGMTVPVVLAPMAGGPSTPQLAAAVSNAGGLGSLGVAYISPQNIADEIARVRALTQGRFAVNLFSPQGMEPLRGNVAAAEKFVAAYHQRLGLAPPKLPQKSHEDFDQQMEVLIRERVPVVSFTFGLLPEKTIAALKKQNLYIIGTATTVEEARLIEKNGADAVVAQGGEAGAHRGTFAVPFESALIGTMALVPQVVDAVKIPVIASGGIMDGRGIVAALALGASAVQMGTAFLATSEAGTSPAYRAALRQAREDQTTVTRAFSGRMARGISNEFIEKWNASGLTPLSYPWQNALTREMRRASGASDPGLLSLWAGQGVPMMREGPAAQLVHQLREEMGRAFAELGGSIQ
ncbi:MAG TPA: nitronate monooxygenase [Candidatus Angelobacter sp.]|nr:nitronate monooxygenase [Candidatus Angelobacter sp.]